MGWADITEYVSLEKHENLDENTFGKVGKFLTTTFSFHVVE